MTGVLIIHASPIVMRLLIIHASHTVMCLLIIHASHMVTSHPTHACHTDMSQSTISHNQPHPIIKLSSSSISLINFTANTISK